MNIGAGEGSAASAGAGAHPGERDIAEFRDAARHMGLERMRDGSWFRRIVIAHVKKHGAAVGLGHWDRLYPKLNVEERAEREIVVVSRKAAATGAFASLGASVGELLSLLTEGLAAPVGLPATMASMGIEAGYTALLQIDLVCDLASIYGVPFNPEDVDEVAMLFGLAFEVDVAPKPVRETEDEPKGLIARLIELEDGTVATRIGRKLLEESVMKNVVPVVGMAISARWNFVATRKLAATARRYLRYRSALHHTLGKLNLAGVADPMLLVEGAWLLATIDGPASSEETMAMGAILDALPEDSRCAIEIEKALAEDEEEWFDDLQRAPPVAQAAFLDVLYLIAAADREVHECERRFLRRVGRTLGVRIEFERVNQIARHLEKGGDLPHGFLRCTS